MDIFPVLMNFLPFFNFISWFYKSSWITLNNIRLETIWKIFNTSHHLQDVMKIGRTKAFYRMSKFDSAQKLSNFEVRDFGRISYKKRTKLLLWNILRHTYQHLQFLFEIAGICTRRPHHSNLCQSIYLKKIILPTSV